MSSHEELRALHAAWVYAKKVYDDNRGYDGERSRGEHLGEAQYELDEATRNALPALLAERDALAARVERMITEYDAVIIGYQEQVASLQDQLSEFLERME